MNRQRNCQLSQHQNLVIDLIEGYLKFVCGIHTEQKAIRIKRAVEKQRLLRLENFIGNNTKQKENNDVSLNSYESKVQTAEEDPSKFEDENTNINSYKSEIKADTNNENNSYEQLELSKDELQLFEQENKHLYEEMNSFTDEIKYYLIDQVLINSL